MKISINCKNISGPYGGAISFARSLKQHASSNGHIVVDNLTDTDINIIIITAYSKYGSASYSYHDAVAYQILHPKTAIILRVNECDERKGTTYMNPLLTRIAKSADHIVFIGSWLRPLLVKSGLDQKQSSSIILNGADQNIFNSRGHKEWDGNEPLRIVTHHWGGGPLKGHDIYKTLDVLLERPQYKNRYSFTFIGNIPNNIIYHNTTLIPPLSGQSLAKEIKKHHIYLTASVNEPAGMHHIEGALCGLPLIFRKSGALPEYCNSFGVAFTSKDFLDSLEKIRKEYSYFQDKIHSYQHTAKKMASEYFSICERIHQDRLHRNIQRNSRLSAWARSIARKSYGILDSLILQFWIYLNHKFIRNNSKN